MLASQRRRKVIFENRVLTFMLLGKDSEANALLRSQTELAKISCNFNVLLQNAAKWNSWQTAQRLIELGAKVDYSTSNGNTPFTIAFEHNSFHTIKVLLEANADIDRHNAIGESVLKMVLRLTGRRLRSLASTKSFECLKAFFQGLNARIIGNEELFAEKLIDAGCSLLQAAMSDNLELLECMLKRGFHIDSQSSQQMTALHGTVAAGYLDTTKWLVDKGANVDARDVDDKSPLFIAALSCDKEIVRYLLKRGADPNVVDRETGGTPLYAIFGSAVNFFGEYSRDLRVDASVINDCVELLLQHGAVPRNSSKCVSTIVDFALSMEKCPDAIYFVIAHLVMLEKNLDEQVTKNFIHYASLSLFEEKRKFEKYYEVCQEVITVEMFDKLTLVDLLNASDRKMMMLVRNESFVSAIMEVCSKHKLKESHLYYYKTLLKRVSDGTDMLELEDKAITVISKMFNRNCNLCYDFGREVVEYLNKRELEQFCQVYE